MIRKINKVAVLGSGIMGSRIACHFANIGVRVFLLDVVPRELSDKEKGAGLTLENPLVRNRLVNDSLKAALASNPSPVFSGDVAGRITTGNFEDNMKDIAGCDWVIEVVVENLKIKQSVYEQVEKFRTPGTLMTTNTSGIPIHLLSGGRSEDFRKHFCGTHFFNPPRYLRLLEIIPTKDTDPEVIDFLMHYGDLFLGKTTVACKDTPAFIANRVGVFSIMAIFRIMETLELNVDEIDALTGPVIGHPKSATFRTCDVVGIDTLVKVAEGLEENCPQDEAREWFKVPDFVRRLVAENRLGEKTGAGFYKKEKTADGKQILTLDLKTLEYGPKTRPHFASVDQAKPLEDLGERLVLLSRAKDKAGEFYRKFHARLFSYVAHRIPEITDELYKIDDALKAGFGWELGPFEVWDLLGMEATREQMSQEGAGVPAWVDEMVAAGNTGFYKVQDGRRLFYDQRDKTYKPIPGTETFILLGNYSENIVWQNSACTLQDIGDGVLNLSWKTKMNTIGGEVLEGVNKSIERAEKDFAGLVIANESAVFSAGANVGLIFMLAAEQEWDELHLAVRTFQNTSMRLRYSDVPVVVAPRGLTLGGGCEFCLHADKVQAAAETYIGLVEMGVGLIPAGGGTKEFTLRASDDYHKGEIELPTLRHRFMTIAQAKVATSGEEAYSLGIFRRGHDGLTLNENRLIADAKRSVLDRVAGGYTRPDKRNNVKVLGREALGAFLTGINSMGLGNYISEYDEKIARKLAWVMSGGDLSQPTLVSEQYLLDLEREAFVSLCGEPKTLERLQSVIKTGKPLRN
jgi:3-hydroxyacyl-CoA dehydrogenase